MVFQKVCFLGKKLFSSKIIFLKVFIFNSVLTFDNRGIIRNDDWHLTSQWNVRLIRLLCVEWFSILSSVLILASNCHAFQVVCKKNFVTKISLIAPFLSSSGNSQSRNLSLLRNVCLLHHLQKILSLRLFLRLFRLYRFRGFRYRRGRIRLSCSLQFSRLPLLFVALEGAVELAPGPVDAGAGSSPPVVDVFDVRRKLLELRVVQHRAHAAEELRVDELAGALPNKKS